MTEADDNVVELRDLDRLFEEVLAGEAPRPDAPAWYGDLARLVRGARAVATPAELAAQDDIVSRMVAVRSAATAPGVVGTAAADDDVDPGVRPVATTTAVVLTAPSVTADDVPDRPPPDRFEGAHLPRHARRDRGYRAKHAAARMQASSNPTVRGVGQLIAFKAAAVTTAVVVGTVAAAAATTGIVANVVVPAFTGEAPDAPPATKTTTTEGTERGGTGGGGDEDVEVTVPVPECQLAPVCSPLTPAMPTTDPVPARPTGPSVPTTERPGAATTTTAPPTSTTTESPPTTQPEQTTTTTETPPTTAPEPMSTMSGAG